MPISPADLEDGVVLPSRQVMCPPSREKGRATSNTGTQIHNHGPACLNMIAKKRCCVSHFTRPLTLMPFSPGNLSPKYSRFFRLSSSFHLISREITPSMIPLVPPANLLARPLTATDWLRLRPAARAANCLVFEVVLWRIVAHADLVSLFLMA